MTSPKPAYIISVHKRPDLVARLVRALGDVPIAIHVDRKSDIFDELRSICRANFLNRHSVHWGQLGSVRASLDGLAWFLRTDASHAILLSGQCYPLRSNEEIVEDLRELGMRSILETASFPKAEWSGWNNGGFRRIDRYHIRVGSRLRSVKLWSRRVPDGLHPHGGSAFWCLSRLAAENTLSYVQAHINLLQFFSTTLIPDEMFYQTVLANSSVRGEIISALTHYTDWSDGGFHPAVLTASRLSAAMKSGAWFGRKFEDIDVVDQVDTLREAFKNNSLVAPWRLAANLAH